MKSNRTALAIPQPHTTTKSKIITPYFELYRNIDNKARAVSFLLSGCTIISILSIHESSRSPSEASGPLLRMAAHFSTIFKKQAESCSTGLASMLKHMAIIIGYTSGLSARSMAFRMKGSNSCSCMLFSGVSNMCPTERINLYQINR